VNFPLQLGVEADAVIGGESQEYRYMLRRKWSSGPSPTLCFVMLNPSTADAMKDDPTIRKCVTFARKLGYGEMLVVNLFAYRTPSPLALQRFKGDAVGPLNDEHLEAWAGFSSLTICAWGTGGAYQSRGVKVLRRLREITTPYCLRMTKSGHPEHPLYLPLNLNPIEVPCATI
jgi:hypothetical protein